MNNQKSKAIKHYEKFLNIWNNANPMSWKISEFISQP